MSKVLLNGFSLQEGCPLHVLNRVASPFRLSGDGKMLVKGTVVCGFLGPGDVKFARWKLKCGWIKRTAARLGRCFGANFGA